MTTYKGPPMTLGNMRENGVRAVVVDQLPEMVAVPEVGRRLRCSQCGSKRIDTRPAWHTKLRPGMGI